MFSIVFRLSVFAGFAERDSSAGAPAWQCPPCHRHFESVTGEEGSGRPPRLIYRKQDKMAVRGAHRQNSQVVVGLVCRHHENVGGTRLSVSREIHGRKDSYVSRAR